MKDLTGMQFGRLTAWWPAGRKGHGNVVWLCCCSCGKTSLAMSHHLTGGKTKSCGCFRREVMRELKADNKNFLRHGDAMHGKTAPEYHAWEAIVQRCTNPNNPEYRNYGGRGITICDEWRNSYDAFRAYLLATIGRRPSPTLSIDRINNDKGYAPGNLRWATKREQNLNRRKAA